MTSLPKEIPLDVQSGHVLARLRERAGVTQDALSTRLSISKGNLVELEEGARFEPHVVWNAFGVLADNFRSDDAHSFMNFAYQKFEHFPRPHFFHPDRDILERADRALQGMHEIIHGSIVRMSIARHLQQFVAPIREAAALVASRNLVLAFVGEKGVGKSSAICSLFGLEYLATTPKKGPSIVPLLETGGGGTTVCEVVTCEGNRYSIVVDPMDPSAFDQIIREFSVHCWGLYGPEDERTENEPLAPEVQRVIRNMAGLKRRTQKRSYATVEVDPVEGLILEGHIKTVDALYRHVRQAIFERPRATTELVVASGYESDRHNSRMADLAKLFREVNNGRLADVPFPSRLVITVPRFLDKLSYPSGETRPFNVTVVDTMGVGEVVVREDIDQWIRDPSTVIVFGSHFMSMPDVSTKLLLSHMKDAFNISPGAGKVVILGLPRPGDGMAVKLDDGEPPEAEDIGYGIKASRAARDLRTHGFGDLHVVCANANPQTRYVDEPRAVIAEALSQLRANTLLRLQGLLLNVESLLGSQDNLEVIAAVEEVAARIRSFLKVTSRVGIKTVDVHEIALATVAAAHTSTIWATSLRRGTFESLVFYYVFGVSASKAAMERSKDWFVAFENFLKSQAACQEFDEARHAIELIISQLSPMRGNMAKRIQDFAFRRCKDLMEADPIWEACAGEWGSGSGFRVRVIEHLKGWFDTREDLSDSLETSLMALWESEVLAPLHRMTKP